MKANRLVYALFVGCLLFSACGPNDDDGPSGGNVIQEDHLSDQSWSVVSIATNLDEKAGEIANAVPEPTLAEDGFSRPTYKAFLELKAGKLEDIRDCEADDVYEFTSEGALTYHDGTTDCDGASFTTDALFAVPANWWLNNKTLRIADNDGDTIAYTILLLDETTLEFERRGGSSQFIKYTPTASIEIAVRYTFASNN